MPLSKYELMFASLLDFPDNTCSGFVRSALLRESANEMAGIARYVYLMNSKVFIDQKLITKNLFIKSKVTRQNEDQILP